MGGGNSKVQDKAFLTFVKKLRKDAKVFERLLAIMEEKHCKENAKFLEDYYSAIRIDQSALVANGFITEKEKNTQLRVTITGFYNKFICPGAKMELNLPSHVVKNFQELYSKECNDMIILDPVLSEVLNMVYLNIYPVYESRYGKLDMKRTKSSTALENAGKQTSSLSIGGGSLGSMDAINNEDTTKPGSKLLSKAKSSAAIE